MKSSGSLKHSKASTTIRRRKTPLANRRTGMSRSPGITPAQPITMAIAPALSDGPSRWATSRDVVLALVMAVGLTTVFLSPLRVAPTVKETSTTPPAGRILGENIVVPLRVSVSVRMDAHQWQTTVTPQSGTLAEALSQVAGAAHESFTYFSRGESMYLQGFFGRNNDAGGSWVVSVNGLPVSDLSSQALEQADEILVEWTPV